MGTCGVGVSSMDKNTTAGPGSSQDHWRTEKAIKPEKQQPALFDADVLILCLINNTGYNLRNTEADHRIKAVFGSLTRDPSSDLSGSKPHDDNAVRMLTIQGTPEANEKALY